MLAARVLLATLIALAIALLPIGCNAAQPFAEAAPVAMHGGKGMPCCPPAPTKATPVFCALQCGNSIIGDAPAVSWHPFHAAKTAIAAPCDQPLVGQIVRPPTHPPRV